jgi:hypothetical protein
MVFSCARSGVYDVVSAFSAFGRSLTGSTVQRLLEVMLLLTGCFFVLKVSDDFSRIWLAAGVPRARLGYAVFG